MAPDLNYDAEIFMPEPDGNGERYTVKQSCKTGDAEVGGCVSVIMKDTIVQGPAFTVRVLERAPDFDRHDPMWSIVVVEHRV